MGRLLESTAFLFKVENAKTRKKDKSRTPLRRKRTLFERKEWKWLQGPKCQSSRIKKNEFAGPQFEHICFWFTIANKTSWESYEERWPAQTSCLWSASKTDDKFSEDVADGQEAKQQTDWPNWVFLREVWVDLCNEQMVRFLRFLGRAAGHHAIAAAKHRCVFVVKTNCARGFTFGHHIQEYFSQGASKITSLSVALGVSWMAGTWATMVMMEIYVSCTWLPYGVSVTWKM